MKKRFIALLLLMTALLTLSSCKGFDGFYFNLKNARKEIKLYENYDYFFTKKSENSIIDFVIKKDKLNIVEIAVKHKGNSERYLIQNNASYSINEEINGFEQFGKYKWLSTNEASITACYWCIVSEEFYNLSGGDFTYFEFTHNDKLYYLCCKFV